MAEETAQTNPGGAATLTAEKPDPGATSGDQAVDYKARFEAAEAARMQAEANLKSQRKNQAALEAKLRAKEEADQDRSVFLTELEELKMQQAVLLDELAELKGTREDAYDEDGGRKPKESAAAAMKAKLAAKKAEVEAKQKATEAFNKAALKLNAKLEAHGISREDEDLLAWASKLSGPQEAIEEFDTLLLERQKKTATQAAKSAEEQAKAATRAKAEANGELDIPNSGGGTGEGLPMDKDKLGKYIASLSVVEYEKQRDKINAHKDRLYARGAPKKQ